MKVRAELKYLRIAPRKTRLVADLIRKKKIEEARTILNFAIKKGAGPILKLLNSAVASAKKDFQLDPNNLYIFKITVDEGPKYKRWMPRSRGVAYEIQKKTSHVTIVLDEIIEGKKVRKKKPVKAVTGEKEIKKENIKPEAQKPQFKKEMEASKLNPPPGGEKGIRRIFRRKSI